MATIRRAANLYKTVFSKHVAKKGSPIAGNESEIMSHILWMAERISEFLDAGEEGKAGRWLGFIQGVLWQRGIYSIDELRQHNTMDVDLEGCCLVCHYCCDEGDDVARAFCRIFKQPIDDLVRGDSCPPKCCPLREKE